jgi:hypothetical protein
MQRRIATVQSSAKLDDATKRETLEALRDANNDAMLDLIARGYGGEVADIQELFGKALREPEDAE